MDRGQDHCGGPRPAGDLDFSGKSIKDIWLAYRHLILPPDAPAVQVTECRRAFYSGAEALYRIMMESMDGGEDPTDEDMARMASLSQELVQFGRDVREGRA